MGHSSLIYKISYRQNPIINIVCSIFQNKHDRIFRCYTITKTPIRLISGSGCDNFRRLALQEFKKSLRAQDFKNRNVNLTLLIICLLTCIFFLSILCIAVHQMITLYCLSYVSIMIAASTCDLLCNIVSLVANIFLIKKL